MLRTQRLLTIREAAELLKINPEVMRRWLRNGRVPGLKIGSDWRIRESDLYALLNPREGGEERPVSEAGSATAGGEKGISSPQGPKMCIKSPKWLEYSGLPRSLNEEIGPEAWPIFKKLIEIDFEKGDEESRRIPLDIEELSDRVGYDLETVEAVLQSLERRGHLVLQDDRRQGFTFLITTPVRTPRLILDIPFALGGVRDAPGNALQNRCMRRYLESAAPPDAGGADSPKRKPRSRARLRA